jgi:H+/Cl- antiporter ClcA
MGILGAFVSMATSVILLSLCHLKLNNGWMNPFSRISTSIIKREEMMPTTEILFNWVILTLFSVLAVVGTAWAVLEPKLEGHAEHAGHHML